MKIKIMHRLDYYVGIPLCFILGTCSKTWRLFFRDKNKIPNQPKNILLIKTWGLGNIVMLFPLLERLRKKYPETKIHFLTLKQNAEICEENPWIDECHLLNLEGGISFLRSVKDTVRYLKKKKIDFVLDFDQFSRIAALLAFMISDVRIGFDTKGQGRGLVLTHCVPYLNDKHMSLIFADIVKVVGIDYNSLSPVSIPVGEKDKIFVDNLLKENGISHRSLVIIHPGVGVNVPIRRWSEKRFAKLADKLLEENDICILLTGVKREKELIKEIKEMMNGSAIDLSGRLGVKALVYLVSRSDLVITNDTSLVHIASAMNTPVIGLYGPNTPFLYGPQRENSASIYKALPCSPCITNFNAKQTYCKNPVCMSSIQVEEVFEKAKELLSFNVKKS